MKSSTDPRHQKRRNAVKELFASSFSSQGTLSLLTRKVLAKTKMIDIKISAAAPSWPIEKLNHIDLAILRLAIYELLSGDAPPKVIIDEAVELAKEFGSENSPSFVNGVLGSVYQEITPNEEGKNNG